MNIEKKMSIEYISRADGLMQQLSTFFLILTLLQINRVQAAPDTSINSGWTCIIIRLTTLVGVMIPSLGTTGLMELVPVLCTVAAPQGLRWITVLPEMRGQILTQRAFSSSVRWMKWTERSQQDNPDKRNKHNSYNYWPPTYCQMFYRFCVINICMPFCVVVSSE